MKITEKILVLLCIISVVLKFNDVEGALMLSFLSFFLLSLFYLFFSFLFFNDIPLKSTFKKAAYQHTNWKKILWAIFVGQAFSVAIIGILFVLLQWTGDYQMFIIGFVQSIIVLSFSFIAYLIVKKSKFQLNILIRAGILVMIYLLIYLSKATFVLQ